MVTINDQTFFVNGKPHQIVIGKHSNQYHVVAIQDVPENWKSWDKGLLRVKLHTGNLVSCLGFIQFLIGE